MTRIEQEVTVAIVFTARSADKLQASVKQRDVWDAMVPGLGLRITPTGVKTWTLRYRVGRHQRRLTLGSSKLLSLAEARKRAKDALREVGDGERPGSREEAQSCRERCSPRR